MSVPAFALLPRGLFAAALLAAAGLNAFSQEPKITSVNRSGNQISISWTGNTSHLHLVEFSTTLAADSWSPLRLLRTPAALNTETFPIPPAEIAAGNAKGFFRVRTGPAPTQPNVVVIVTDDGGWADVGYNTAPGQVPVQTPHMDQLKNDGIRLERFYATAVCSVTRACMLTGRNTLRTGVNNARGLDLREHTMPETFRAAGYQTAMCGKWHLGGPYNNHRLANIGGQHFPVAQESGLHEPFRRGWDTHYGEYTGAIDYFTHISKEDGLPDWFLNGQPLVETSDLQGHGGYSTDLLADKAVSFIRQRDPFKPLMLYLAFNGIHGAVQAPQSTINKYAALGITSNNRRLIAAAMDLVDAGIGRVLGAIDSEGLRTQTLVMCFSDNGGDVQKGSINLPLRGTKGDGYDAAFRTTASVRWPGRLPANVVSHQFVWAGDLFPTFCVAAGVTLRNTKPFDGVNLWPALMTASNTTQVPRGKPLITATAPPVAFDEFTDPASGQRRMFKLIRNRTGSTTVYELFNIANDPYETTELSANNTVTQYSPIVTSLNASIDAVVNTAEVYPPFIATQPQSQSVAAGGSVTFYASFSSYPRTAPTVTWRKNGVPLVSGAGVTITPATPAVEPPGVIPLALCSLSSGSTTVTCASTAGLLAGMSLTGPSVPTRATVISITDSTRFVMSLPAAAAASGLAWTASSPVNGLWFSACTVASASPASAGQYDLVVDNTSGPTLRLTNCATAAGSPLISCPSTAGLAAGMNLSGPGISVYATISSIVSSTQFRITYPPATTTSGTTLAAGEGGYAFSNPAELVIH